MHFCKKLQLALDSTQSKYYVQIHNKHIFKILVLVSVAPLLFYFQKL